jgi:hypothetical protein
METLLLILFILLYLGVGLCVEHMLYKKRNDSDKLGPFL